ncbi:hypothetical protein [Lactobacillus intestinalis]|uniref:hypothetical protein n=1 Tax=Lactobacillus intestinalis TaxID=151781 RepID=UPI001F572C98|nr:hypothetical protein [Lactobacillus intestinalis]
MNINEKQTSKKVSNFMRNTINNLLNFTGNHLIDLKKPIACNIPDVDKDDPALKEYFYYLSVLDCIQKALANMTDPYKSIFMKRYIDKLTDEQVALKTNFSKTTVGRYAGYGAVEFAQRFIYYQRINHISPVIDLIAHNK